MQKQKGRDLGGGGVTCTVWKTAIGACSKTSRKLGCLFASLCVCACVCVCAEPS